MEGLARADELRRRGRYDEVKTAAALQESLSRSVLLKGEIGPRQALRVHSFLSNWTLPEDLAEFVETHELGSIGELLQTIQTSLRSYVALFGPSLLQDLGDDIEFFDGGEPMMSRSD